MYKELFNIPENTIYLASHSTGCLPKRTAEALQTCMHNWATLGTDAWDIWATELDYFNQALAKMLQSKQPNECCLQTNTSSAAAKIIGSLPQRKGRNKIIISDMDFPSIAYVIKNAERLGYQIETIHANNGKFELEQWQRHLTDDVQLVLVTHVLSRNNFQNPIYDIIEHANQHGIFSIVDVAQSIGVLPIDVTRLNANFVIGNCIKWLCGGPIAGFLWANQKSVAEFMPMDIGWFSAENPFALQGDKFQYAANASRFLGGTPAIIACLIARNSMDVMNEIGIEKIYAHNQLLSRSLIDYAINKKLNMQSPQDTSQRGGTTCIKFPDPMKAYHALKKHGIITDSAKTINPHANLRISPHIYNNAQEIEQLIHCMDELLL